MYILVTGKPRAGKSYRVVHDLLNLPRGKYYIYHNIPGLKESMVEDGRYIERWQGPKGELLIPNFFTVEKQAEIAQWLDKEYGRKMLVVVDEAGKWFKRYDEQKFAWLSWHGHEGQDIWFCCQHRNMIHKDYYELAEYELRAKPRLVRIGKRLQYQYEWGGEKWGAHTLVMQDHVMRAYKSFNVAEEEKGKPRLLMAAGLVCVAVLVLGVYLIGWRIPQGFGAEKSRPVQAGKRNSVQYVKQEQRKDVQVPKVEAPRLREPLEEYTIAGRYGEEILLQECATGALVDLGEVVGRYKIVQEYPLQVYAEGRIITVKKRQVMVEVKREGINRGIEASQFGVVGGYSGNDTRPPGGVGAGGTSGVHTAVPGAGGPSGVGVGNRSRVLEYKASGGVHDAGLDRGDGGNSPLL